MITNFKERVWNEQYVFGDPERDKIIGQKNLVKVDFISTLVQIYMKKQPIDIMLLL